MQFLSLNSLAMFLPSVPCRSFVFFGSSLWFSRSQSIMSDTTLSLLSPSQVRFSSLPQECHKLPGSQKRQSDKRNVWCSRKHTNKQTWKTALKAPKRSNRMSNEIISFMQVITRYKLTLHLNEEFSFNSPGGFALIITSRSTEWVHFIDEDNGRTLLSSHLKQGFYHPGITKKQQNDCRSLA